MEDLRQLSMEEQLDALSEKITRLAQEERVVSRRMACRGSHTQAQSSSCTIEPRSPSRSPKKQAAKFDPDDAGAKRRNERLEDFCDHWMAWLRGGSLREGADAVAVHREKFLESVEAMLPAWGELTSRETQIALAEAKSQLEVLRERRREAMKHLHRSRELGEELRQIQVELKQQHLELPSLYIAAQGALNPEAVPVCTPKSQFSAEGQAMSSPCAAVHQPSEEPAARPEDVKRPPLPQPASDEARETEVPARRPEPAEDAVTTWLAHGPLVGEERQDLPAGARGVPEPTVPVAPVSPSPERRERRERQSQEEPSPAEEVKIQEAPKANDQAANAQSEAPRPVVCQVSQPQQVLLQVKSLLTPLLRADVPPTPSALRKLLRSPEPWYKEVLQSEHPELAGSSLHLLAAALLLLKGHMSSNLAEAASAASCDAASLRSVRSPGGHSMAWQELLAILPRLAELCPKSDFEALCKIFAEQLLPRARMEPVRRLGQALVQAASPEAMEERSPKSEDTEKNASSVLSWRMSEPSNPSAYRSRPKLSALSRRGTSKDQLDLSRMIRSDPAWRLAKAEESDEIAELDDL